MKKVVPQRTVKKQKPSPKAVARPAARIVRRPSKGRSPAPLRKPLVAVKSPPKIVPPSKPAAKVAIPHKVIAAKPVVVVVPPKVVVQLPKPNLSVRPMPKNPPVIIPPRPNANGLPAKPGMLMPKPVPKLATPTSTAPAKVESTIPADKDLSIKGEKSGHHIKDRLVLMVPDPFWLHTTPARE